MQRNIVDNANVTFNQATNGTYAGVLSGTGNLPKNGTGTVTLFGANTYSGGTTVSAGSLIGTTTSLQGNIVDNANVTFNQATSGAYAGVLSGTGSLTKSGAGTVTLSGANTYTGGTTVSAGILQVDAAGALPDSQAITVNAGTFDLNNISETVSTLSGTGGTITFGTGTLTVNGSGSASYAGSLQGSGSLVKAGTGTMTLFGATRTPVARRSRPVR